MPDHYSFVDEQGGRHDHSNHDQFDEEIRRILSKRRMKGVPRPYRGTADMCTLAERSIRISKRSIARTTGRGLSYVDFAHAAGGYLDE
jgi:hypothetical protein